MSSTCSMHGRDVKFMQTVIGKPTRNSPHVLNCGRDGRIIFDLLRSGLFWDITQCRVAIPYRRFGKTYRSHRQRSRNQRRKSVKNYHHTLSNIPEERRFYLLPGGSLKSRMDSFSFSLWYFKEEIVQFLGLA